MSKKTKAPEMKLFLWHWVGGGYNSCRAKNITEARKIAKTMGAPSGIRQGLKVERDSLREVTQDVVDDYDRRYFSLFY